MLGTFESLPSGPIFSRNLCGEGQPVVCVHGLGGSHLNWVPPAPDLARLGQVIAFDLPGFGYSPPHRSTAIRHYVKVTIELLEQLGGEVLLVGNSMGGLVAMLVAASRPDLLRGLVLVAPAAPPRFKDPRIDRTVAKRLVLQGVPFVGETLISRYWRSTTAAQQIRDTLAIVCHRPERVSPDLWPDALALAEARRHQPWAIEALIRSGRSTGAILARRADYARMARSIAVPTLLIQGGHDRVVSGSAVEWLAELRSDWTHIVMEDAGHCPQLEAPLEFSAHVTDWWKVKIGAE